MLSLRPAAAGGGSEVGLAGPAPGCAAAPAGAPHLAQNRPSTAAPQLAQNGMAPPKCLSHRPGGPSTNRGITAPATPPAIKAGLPAPRKEINNPTSEPIPAPTTAIIILFAIGVRTSTIAAGGGCENGEMKACVLPAPAPVESH